MRTTAGVGRSGAWRRLVGAALLALVLGSLMAPAAALAAGGSSASPTATAASSASPTATAASSASPTATAASSASPTATAATTVTAPNNPLSGGVTPIGPSATAVPTTSSSPTIISGTTTSGSSSLSGGSAIGIAVGAFLVIGGISYFIWRDSRRRAPTHARAVATETPRIPGSKRPPKARKLSPAERRRRKRGRSR